MVILMPENNRRQISEAEAKALDHSYKFIEHEFSAGDLSNEKDALSKLEPKTEYGPRVNAVINIAKGKVNAQDIAHLSEDQKNELMAFSGINKPATDLNGRAGFFAKTIRGIVSALTKSKAYPVESLLKEIEHDNKYDTEKLHKLEGNGGHYIYNAAATTNIGMTGMKAAIDQSNAIWDQTVTDLESSAKQSKTKADDHHREAIDMYLTHAQNYQSAETTTAAQIIIDHAPNKNVKNTISYKKDKTRDPLFGIKPSQRKAIDAYSAASPEKKSKHISSVLPLGISPEVQENAKKTYSDSRSDASTELATKMRNWATSIESPAKDIKSGLSGPPAKDSKSGTMSPEEEKARKAEEDHATRALLTGGNMHNKLDQIEQYNHHATALENLAKVVAANHSSRAANNL